jgi:hypothetical protein
MVETEPEKAIAALIRRRRLRIAISFDCAERLTRGFSG